MNHNSQNEATAGYPRVCGVIYVPAVAQGDGRGLSPRVRGNPYYITGATTGNLNTPPQVVTGFVVLVWVGSVWVLG